MTKEGSMESLKVNIRSVVQSKKGGVPLLNLQGDYYKLIGEKINFHAYNFESLYDLMINIPECIKVKRINNQLLVEAVANESTSHLESLISKQKRTKSKKAQPPPYRFRQNKLIKTVSTSSSNVSVASQEFEENHKRDQSPPHTFHQNNLTKNFSCGSSSNVSVASQDFEENHIVKNLKSELEKEQKANQESSLEILRLKSELKNVKETLKTEQESSKNMKASIENLKASFEEKKEEAERNNLLIKYHIRDIEILKVSLEKEKKAHEIFTSEIKSKGEELKKLQKQITELKLKSKDIENYKKEIEDLKSKLEKEKRISQAFSDRSENLKTLLENNEKTSNEKIEKLQNILTLLKQEKEIKILKEESNSWNSAVDLNETILDKELKNIETTIADCNHADHYVKLEEKFQNTENKLKLLGQDVSKTMMMQKKHYSIMDTRIIKHCNSIGTEAIIKKLLVHPLFLNSLQSSLTLLAEKGMSSASTNIESSADKK